jgi:hypothetical protein
MFMASETTSAPVRRIEDLIFLVRGQRVMLDSDLARVYGVTTIRMNEQFKRNRTRFPENFAFQLTREELTNLRSQIAISSLHGGRRYLPWVFTEHGAVMLASVLNSPTAIKASIRVVETFILMREQLATHKELAHKLAELEQRVSGHDSQLQNLFEAIRHLIEPPLPERRQRIGFHETAPPYRVKARSRL